MITKTQRAIDAMMGGDTLAALRIARTFRFGLTGAERAQIGRAYECMVRPEFYKSIGYNSKSEIDKGVDVFYNKIGGER